MSRKAFIFSSWAIREGWIVGFEDSGITKAIRLSYITNASIKSSAGDSQWLIRVWLPHGAFADLFLQCDSESCAEKVLINIMNKASGVGDVSDGD